MHQVQASSVYTTQRTQAESPQRRVKREEEKQKESACVAPAVATRGRGAECVALALHGGTGEKQRRMKDPQKQTRQQLTQMRDAGSRNGPRRGAAGGDGEEESTKDASQGANATLKGRGEREKDEGEDELTHEDTRQKKAMKGGKQTERDVHAGQTATSFTTRTTALPKQQKTHKRARQRQTTDVSCKSLSQQQRREVVRML